MKKETITGKEVRYILRQNRVNLRQLADAIGISPQALNSRLNATVFSPLHLDEITDALGRDLFGSNDTKERTSIIPVLDLRVCAGNGIGLEGDENQITEYVTIPSMKGCYGLTVYGDSMLPRYRSGDIVFVRPIPDTSDIDYGSAYLVITQSDRLLKLVYPSQTDDAHLMLSAVNTDTTPQGVRLFPDREIPKEQIIHLYKVIGSLSREQI